MARTLGLAASGAVDVVRQTPVMPSVDGFELEKGGHAKWGADAGDMGAIFLQVPVRVYFHASRMLKNG